MIAMWFSGDVYKLVRGNTTPPVGVVVCDGT